MSKARDLADLAKNANDRLDTVATSDGALSNRNLIANGDMRIAQRSTNVTGITTTSGYYTLDRWAYYVQSTGALEYTMSQDSDAPAGFGSSLKMECTASQTLLTNANIYIRQLFEGQNLQQIGFGTSDAQSVTVSFWVKASKTGLFTLNLYRQDNTRTTGLSYEIDTADTWEYKTLTFPPDTTGALDDDNNASMQVAFFIGSGPDLQSGTFSNGTWESYSQANYAVNGQTNIATDGDTFQITGVQLEVGDTATPFEHRSYGDELQRCKRYYQVINKGRLGGVINGTGDGIVLSQYIYPLMRADPTTAVVGVPNIYYMDGGSQLASTVTGVTGGGYRLNLNKANGSTGDSLSFWVDCDSTKNFTFDAEL